MHIGIDLCKNVGRGTFFHGAYVGLSDGWMEIINNMFSQVTSDKERKLLFTVFDENRSWYFEENIKQNSEDPTKIDRNDPDFYNSNVMHSGC